MWQESVPSIVMVTNIKEDGKVKCHQYWPESGHQKYGPFTVSIIEQTSLSDYVIRNFEIMVRQFTVVPSAKCIVLAWDTAEYICM